MSLKASARSTSGPMAVLPFDNGFGCEIAGLDLSQPLTQGAFDAWQQAFERYSVVVIRSQSFTDARHVAFSRWFGRLEEYEDPKDQAEGFNTIIRVSNIDKYTDAIKSLDDLGHKSFTLGTSDWHTDSSFRKVPSKASLLYAREVPPVDGDTAFASTSMAWAALPDDMKRKIATHTVVHDFEETRRRFGLPPRPPDIRAKLPPVTHPLVTTLPDGRKALLIGMHAAQIAGMSKDESHTLLEELKAFATQPQFTYRHKWNVGDLVMWDNRCTMHRAMPYALERDRRLLHRTTVAGDEAGMTT
ncbi:MAG: TauD/TfdA family dioxygenase [Hyphomicrobiales bacterium]|nr:TauD/TfdA family dioxygenase [Hyphomicrobiales bacterium]